MYLNVSSRDVVVGVLALGEVAATAHQLLECHKKTFVVALID